MISLPSQTLHEIIRIKLTGKVDQQAMLYKCPNLSIKKKKKKKNGMAIYSAVDAVFSRGMGGGGGVEFSETFFLDIIPEV